MARDRREDPAAAAKIKCRKTGTEAEKERTEEDNFRKKYKKSRK